MKKAEEHAIRLVRELVPNCEKLEFWATIGDTSRTIEFHVWIDGQKHQCYELADNGQIEETKMEKLFDDYAAYVRKSDEYSSGKLHKITFSYE